MEKSKNKKFIFSFIFLTISIIAIIIIALLLNKQSLIVKNDTYAQLKLDNVNNITISYLDNTKKLSNEQKDKFLKLLIDFKYIYVNEELLMVCPVYKVDFNNGIYFTFGNFGTHVDVFEKNEKNFTTDVPLETLEYIRNLFNNSTDRYNNDDNTIIEK